MEDIINIKNLTFSYGNGDLVLDDISLNIKQGEFISIIGPNGCGKSTFVKQLNGVLTPSSGEVKVMNYLTTDVENIFNIRKNISMVFQNPDNQIVATIVEEDVAFTLENLGVDPIEIRKRVDKSLEMVNMLEYSKHATYQLSGGQKQRVAIASAISSMPKCIVLDEPTSMLDPIGRKDITNLIYKLSKEYNMTVIFITHFMDEACLADRLIVMDKGKIMIDSSPLHVLEKEDQLIKLGLELPKPTYLCKQLKSRGYYIDKSVITVEEAVEALKLVLEGKRK